MLILILHDDAKPALANPGPGPSSLLRRIQKSSLDDQVCGEASRWRIDSALHLYVDGLATMQDHQLAD